MIACLRHVVAAALLALSLGVSPATPLGEIEKKAGTEVTEWLRNVLRKKPVDQAGRKAANEAFKTRWQDPELRSALERMAKESNEEEMAIQMERENAGLLEETRVAWDTTDPVQQTRIKEYERRFDAAVESDAERVDEETEFSEKCKGKFRKLPKEVVCYWLKTWVKGGKPPDDAALVEFLTPKLVAALGECALSMKSNQAAPKNIVPFDTLKILQQFRKDVENLPFSREVAMAFLYFCCLEKK